MISNFSSNFPKATIHAFEPYEPYALELIDKFKSNNNICINTKGLSNQIGESFDVSVDENGNLIVTQVS